MRKPKWTTVELVGKTHQAHQFDGTFEGAARIFQILEGLKTSALLKPVEIKIIELKAVDTKLTGEIVMEWTMRMPNADPQSVRIHRGDYLVANGASVKVFSADTVAKHYEVRAIGA